MSEYTIHDYTTGEQIGTAMMTDRMFRGYTALAQQPEGIIELSDLVAIISEGGNRDIDLSIPVDGNEGNTVYVMD